MAAAFDKVGFNTVDVHMSDLLAGRISLDDFEGLVACGGFSYGDVMGAGGGWAKSVLFNPKLRDQFEKFFNRDETFSLGICNGCQMLSQLAPLIPGADGRGNLACFHSLECMLCSLDASSSHITFAGYPERAHPACRTYLPPLSCRHVPHLVCLLLWLARCGPWQDDSLGK